MRVLNVDEAMCFVCAPRTSKASSAGTGFGTFVRRAAPPPTSHFVLVRHGKKCNCKQAFFAHVGRANLRENGLSHLSSLLQHEKSAPQRALSCWRREGFSSAAPRKRRRRKRASVLSCAALRRLLLRTSCLCAMAKNAIASKHFLRMSGARTSVKTDFLISLLRATKKPAKRRVFMAQRRGFEPPDESPPSHDFQSCSLNHSDISAKTSAILQQTRGKSNCF